MNSISKGAIVRKQSKAKERLREGKREGNTASMSVY